jgi:hypothetical protein
MAENIITLDADNATVKSVVNQIKSDMRGGAKYGAYVAEFNVTHETVKDHARALAALVTPEGPQAKDGVRTRYGNAVQAAGNGLRSALGKKNANTDTDWIRLVRQAAENAANKGNKSADEIMAAVKDALSADETTLTAVA